MIAEFINRLEEASWGACTAQTLNYMIVNELAKAPLNITSLIICNPSMTAEELEWIREEGAIPVTIGYKVDGAQNLPADTDGLRWIVEYKAALI